MYKNKKKKKKKTTDGGMQNEQRSQLKKLPVIKNGKIWRTKWNFLKHIEL